MTEPKLTMSETKTWRPAEDARTAFEEYLKGERGCTSFLRAMNRLTEEAAALPPPLPQSEAKAEPEEDPRFMANRIWHAVTSSKAWPQAAVEEEIRKDRAAANARIAELVRERDEARKELREIYDAESVLVAERYKTWEKAREGGFRAGYAKGVAAAKEACAKRLLDEADAHSNSGNPVWFTLSQMSARMVRETEVPGP